MSKHRNLNNRWRKVKVSGGAIIFTSSIGYVRQQSESIWSPERCGPWVPVIRTNGLCYTPGSIGRGHRKAIQAIRMLEQYLTINS